jgi:hypothetical protein
VDAVTLLNRLVSDVGRHQGQRVRVWGCTHGGDLHGCVDQDCGLDSMNVDGRNSSDSCQNCVLCGQRLWVVAIPAST